MLVSPHAGHSFARIWYSVTSGGGGGAASNTCRFCSQAAGHRPGRARSSRTPPGRTPPCHPGCRTASAWKTARRAACRACGRTCRAATCPSASWYTGYRRKAAWTTLRNPCPAAAEVPLPARPAPRSARPALPAAPRPAHRDPRPPAAAGHCRPSAPLPAHAAIRPGQTGIQAANRTQAAVHQSRRSVTSTTRRAGRETIRNQALPAATASPGPQLTHPQPPRLNSYCAQGDFATSLRRPLIRSEQRPGPGDTPRAHAPLIEVSRAVAPHVPSVWTLT